MCTFLSSRPIHTVFVVASVVYFTATNLTNMIDEFSLANILYVYCRISKAGAWCCGYHHCLSRRSSGLVQVSNKSFLPLNRKDQYSVGLSLRPPACYRVRFSNPVCGGQCHLIISIKLSWPRADVQIGMCTTVS